MKDFKINYYNEDKQVVSTQNISMSNQEIDDHKLTFRNNQNEDVLLIDTNNKELILNNTDGAFDALSLDKPTVTIKIDNIKMDYENNLTFSMDSSNKTYRISGGVIEQKQGSKFVPVVSFKEPFNIILPSTFLADIENNNLQTSGLPYQMFEALQDETLNVETYESKNKLLHIVKSGNQLYVGRGHKLIPISKDNQNYYKMGDKSVLGFTIGKNNGITGKQSLGIAFNMDEEELEQVAKFVNNDAPVEFKTEEDYKNNDIDYTRVNKQADVSKKENITNASNNSNNENPANAEQNGESDAGTSNAFTPHPFAPETPSQGNNSQPTPPEKNKPEDNKPDANKPETEKPEDNKEKEQKSEAGNQGNKSAPPSTKEEAKINIAGMATVTAFFIAMMIISGLFVSALAFWIFGILAGIATFTDAALTINYTVNKKPKLTKKEKLEKKIAHKQVQISKLKEKDQTDKIKSKIQKAEKYVQKKQDKLDLLNAKESKGKNSASTENTAQTNATTGQNPYPFAPETQNAVPNTATEENTAYPFAPENPNASTNATAEATTSTNFTPEATNNTQEIPTNGEKKEDNLLSTDNVEDNSVNEILVPTKENINKTSIEIKNMIYERLGQENKTPFNVFAKEIDSKLKDVCPEGLSVNKIPAEEKELFQQMINFRNVYTAVQESGEVADINEIKTDGQQPNLSPLQQNLRDVLYDLYNTTKDYLQKNQTKEETNKNNTNNMNNSSSSEADRQP